MTTRVWMGAVQPEWKVTVTGAPTDAREDNPPLDAADEAALVAACLAGRKEAFDVIVERHRRHVYQLCYRFVGNRLSISGVPIRLRDDRPERREP